MKLHWKIGGAMALIAALVSAAGGVAAYRSTDSELNENIDRSLLDSAQRVVGRAIDRDHDENDEGHHDDREEDDDNDDTGDDDDNDSNVATPPIRQSDVCPLALLQPVDACFECVDSCVEPRTKPIDLGVEPALDNLEIRSTRQVTPTTWREKLHELIRHGGPDFLS